MRRGAGGWPLWLVMAGCTTGGGGDGPSVLTLGGGSTDGTAATEAGSAGDDDGASASVTGGPGSDEGATSTPGTSPSTGDDTGSTGGDTTSGPPPMSCDDDPGACDAWVLPPGGDAWEAITIGGPVALAPAGDVLAAFDVEAPEIAYVVSGSDVSVLDLATRSWTSRMDFAAIFGELGSDPLLAAYSVPAGMADPDTESVTLVSADTAYIYAYDIPNEAFAFDQATVFGAGWELPEAPAGADIRAMWVDLANAEGWIDPSMPTPCGVDAPIAPNLPVIAADRVHVMEAGTCFEFFAPVDYPAFAPFALPGAPDVALVGAALFSSTQGLWLFRGA